MVLAVCSLVALPVAPLAAIGLATVEFITFFDNAVVAAGNTLGIGPRLYRFNKLRFLLHAVLIALLIPAYAGVGQGLGVPAFSTTLFQAFIGALTVGVALFGYLAGYRPLKRIVPVNYYGCLRYAQSVTASGRRDDYEYSDEELAAKGFPPFASILTVLIGLVLSVWTGLASGFWVPAMVTGLMMLAGRFPPNAVGALATSALEVLFSTGLVFSLLVATNSWPL